MKTHFPSFKSAPPLRTSKSRSFGTKKSHIIIALGLVFAFYSPLMFAQSNSENWKKNGNTVDPGDFFGSTNLADITIKTNNLPLAVFTADGKIILIPSGTGNVGIGVTEPSALLDVGGVIHSKSLFADQMVSTDTLKVGVVLNILDKVCIETLPGAGSICGKSFPLKIQSDPLFNSNTIINADNTGNVGIGTSGPGEKLDVLGNGRFSGNLTAGGKILVSRLSSMQGDSLIYFGDSSIILNSVRNYYYVDAATNPTFKSIGYGFNCWGVGANSVSIGNNAHTTGSTSVAVGKDIVSFASNSFTIGTGADVSSGRLINTISNSLAIGFNSNLPTLFIGPSAGIGTTGKVGIGNSNPFYELDVCGTIRSKEWIVETGWCDFKFEPGYQRMTWREKLSFIQKNKHLPEIDPGKEIELNGLKAGKTMRGFIWNIEDNTLDIIDLQKENESLKLKNAELEKRIEALEQKVENK